ncbi:MAG: enoyl-CoA hydratase/isomerase family protein [Bdellovibrionales bacterium]|nr:enoyl-CoA hydratase/isomerase family protein [Bdellovibrionales bacterium]
MSSQLLVFSEEPGGIVRILLNDPDTRNAMSEAMAEAFAAVVRELRKREDVRVVVLTGAGRAFSGGGHLEMLFDKTKLERQQNVELMQQFYRQFLSITELEVPVVAAINGHAVGAGLCLAMACDVRIAVQEAKLGLNFVQLGLHPGMGATYFLPRLVGPAHAAALLFSGRIISASEAEGLGLVNRCVPQSQFDEVVRETVESIAQGGPIAIRQLKASLRSTFERQLDECLFREAVCQAENYSGAEFLEGITAAREKRKPHF